MDCIRFRKGLLGLLRAQAYMDPVKGRCLSPQSSWLHSVQPGLAKFEGDLAPAHPIPDPCRMLPYLDKMSRQLRRVASA